ncbi:hypothetical protein ER308_17345 [Egibacter rhizosphaerae]|uniref:Uncharacterized protein n=1 Tax=Egibacter rhizosphaerae TaxID=1670831 RepID=A0A411YJ99_9ACTN|nr:hypothetical protein [Egibacter rhizosphaerae]QBI21162.1 hypothetical protein ER308_17345 [Egibacter rhizosphaerae]
MSASLEAPMSSTDQPGTGTSSPVSVPAFLHDPELRVRRSWREAGRLGALIGLPAGFAPGALLLEFAPHLGAVTPALASFLAGFVGFTLLARVEHRSLVWLVTIAGAMLLSLSVVGLTAWTLTRSLTDALT